MQNMDGIYLHSILVCQGEQNMREDTHNCNAMVSVTAQALSHARPGAAAVTEIPASRTRQRSSGERGHEPFYVSNHTVHTSLDAPPGFFRDVKGKTGKRPHRSRREC